MTGLKRQDIFLTLVFAMIFVFAFSVSGYSSEPPGFPPTADAGPDLLLECTSPSGADATLDGSGSSDPDGDALTYLWTWNGSSETGMNPTINFPLGITTVTLEVDDGQYTDQDTSDITVEDTIAPDIACIGTSLITTNPNGEFIDLSLNVDAQDLCSPVQIDCDPMMSGIFPVGSTDVTCTATDTSGNTIGCDFTVEVVFEVPVDIKPTSCPNPLNVKSKGVLPVAILGTADFDVADVDISTVELEGVSAIPNKYQMEDVATPFNGVSSDDCHDCTEDGPDGFMDLTLYFDSQELVAAIGDINDGDCLSLTLTGALLDGTPIEVSDSLIIIKKR